MQGSLTPQGTSVPSRESQVFHGGRSWGSSRQAQPLSTR